MGKAERGEKEDENDRDRGDSPGGLFGSFEGGEVNRDKLFFEFSDIKIECSKKLT